MADGNGGTTGAHNREERHINSSFSRYTKGLLVKLNEPVRPHNVLDSILNPVLVSSTNGTARPREFMLSASERMDPAVWQKQLARAAAQPRENGRASLANGQAAEQPIANGRAESASSAEEADTLQEGEADGDVSQPDYRPSPGAPLGEAGRSHGRELIAAMRHARHVLQASLQNLAGARDEAVYAQRAFYPLMRLLEDADSLMRTCSTRHPALETAQTWLGNVHTVVHELDANASGLLMDSGAGSCLAPDWASYAQNAALRLRDLEDELWQGQLLGIPVRTDLPQGPAVPANKVTSRRPTMPYRQHWRNKAAL